MPTVKVDADNFKETVLNSSIPVVVDFWAEWCGPCKMIGPSLEAISDGLKDKVLIAKLNVDESPDLAAEYNVRSIPMLAVFKAGQVVDIKIGAASRSQLDSWIGAAA